MCEIGLPVVDERPAEDRRVRHDRRGGAADDARLGRREVDGDDAAAGGRDDVVHELTSGECRAPELGRTWGGCKRMDVVGRRQRAHRQRVNAGDPRTRHEPRIGDGNRIDARNVDGEHLREIGELGDLNGLAVSPGDHRAADGCVRRHGCCRRGTFVAFDAASR